MWHLSTSIATPQPLSTSLLASMRSYSGFRGLGGVVRMEDASVEEPKGSSLQKPRIWGFSTYGARSYSSPMIRPSAGRFPACKK